MLVEVGNAIPLRIVNVIGKYRSALLTRVGIAEQGLEVMAVEDVVTEDQRRRVVTDEISTDREGLSKAVWTRLYGIGEVETPMAAVSQKLLEARGVLGRGDDQDVADTSEQQGAERVVDHRLVVDRQQLFGDGEGSGVEAGAGATRKYNAFPSHREPLLDDDYVDN